MDTKKIKKQLALVFDNDLETKQWYNIVDYTIIFLILLSTVEVFLSTIPSIEERYHNILLAIDYFTIAFFSIEVLLRIWCAGVGEGNEKYRGWKGKIRYCLSFYGLVDILSTYTFYLSLFLPISYTIFKVIRTIRLVRVFRYLKSFEILIRAIQSKKQEFWISIQFILIVTIILALIAYFVENAAQPDSCGSSIQVLIWAFAQYVGDPGGFVQFEPVTFVGRMIAFTIGILQIAIFAVPAGLLASGFSEEIEDEKNKNTVQSRIAEIVSYFKQKEKKKKSLEKRISGDRYATFDAIQAYLLLSDAEILEAVRESENLRFRPTKSDPQLRYNDMKIVEYYESNTPYGFYSEHRNSEESDSSISKSNITIISPQSAKYQGIGHFSRTIWQNCKCHFISREQELRTTEGTAIGYLTTKYYNLLLSDNTADQQEAEKKLGTAAKAMKSFVDAIKESTKGNFTFIMLRGTEKEDLIVQYGAANSNNATVREQDKNAITMFCDILKENCSKKIGNTIDSDNITDNNEISNNSPFTMSICEKGFEEENNLANLLFKRNDTTVVVLYVNKDLLSGDVKRYNFALNAIMNAIEKLQE